MLHAQGNNWDYFCCRELQSVFPPALNRLSKFCSKSYISLHILKEKVCRSLYTLQPANYWKVARALFFFFINTHIPPFIHLAVKKTDSMLPPPDYKGQHKRVQDSFLFFLRHRGHWLSINYVVVLGFTDLLRIMNVYV